MKNYGSSRRANYGTCTSFSYIDATSEADYFVIPKEKAWHTGDQKLLQLITDELAHGGENISVLLCTYG